MSDFDYSKPIPTDDETLKFFETEVLNRSYLIQGFPLTNEARIIAALVNRLGGNVTITEKELSDVQGIIFEEGYNGKEMAGDVVIRATTIEPTINPIYHIDKTRVFKTMKDYE